MAYTLKIQAKDLSDTPLKLEPAWWKYKEILHAYPFKKELSQASNSVMFRRTFNSILNLCFNSGAFKPEFLVKTELKVRSKIAKIKQKSVKIRVNIV